MSDNDDKQSYWSQYTKEALFSMQLHEELGDGLNGILRVATGWIYYTASGSSNFVPDVLYVEAQTTNSY